MNVPLRSSVMVCRNSSSVFMTIGPYHATGSLIGLPDTERKRLSQRESDEWELNGSVLQPVATRAIRFK